MQRKAASVRPGSIVLHYRVAVQASRRRIVRRGGMKASDHEACMLTHWGDGDGSILSVSQHSS